MSLDPRLGKLLGGAALANLRRRLRRHFERVAPDAPSGVLRLDRLNAHEHEALALLTGRPPRHTRSIQLDLAALDAALREAGIAASLRQALEWLDGPIADTAAVRAETQNRWAAVAACGKHPGLAAILHTPAGLGLLKRLAGGQAEVAARLCENADRVLALLPAGGLPLAQLAAQALGDAHALDGGQASATLILAAWRQAETKPDDPEEDEARSRDIWARAGVLVNELARPALFLNLPSVGHEPPLSAPGEPGYVSLRRLLRAPPDWAVAGRAVFVCENPNLIAIAADQLGERCAPLVCTDGMPAAAQRNLLAQLDQAGARLRYHGDFDWPGLHIANHVLRHFGARPWRFGASDYEAAIPLNPRQEQRLSGQPAMASWDAGLAPAMQTHGLAIHEESLATSLLPDLISGED
ncbi:MAG: TIGR02679 family protein [Gallionellaceae bacterium]|nr:TIGR02679 family protein [Gallionellaceae bacterium]